MRAAETGRPVLHAAISGETAVIDAHGNVSHTTGLFERTIVDTRVALTTGTTLYVRYGEWVTWLSLAGVLVAIAFGVARRRRGFVDSPAVTARDAAANGEPAGVAPERTSTPV